MPPEAFSRSSPPGLFPSAPRFRTVFVFQGSLRRIFQTGKDSPPPRFTFGDAGRFLPENRAPGLETWDVSFAKTFVIRESMRLMLRAETFNLLNRANFLSPAIAFNTAQFGTISESENPRRIQLALKLTF